MGAEQQVRLGADRLAQPPDEEFRAVEGLQVRLAAVVDRIGPGRIELHRGEALGDAGGRPLRGQVWVAVDALVLARLRVEIGVAAQALAEPAAEQLVDRLVQRLADDVPAGHLDPAQDPDQRQVRPQAVAAAVDRAPQPLDLEGVGPDHVAFADVLDHARQGVRAEGGGVDLADALDAALRRQLDEDEVAAAEVRRRIADDEGLDLGDLHGALAPVAGPASARAGAA